MEFFDDDTARPRFLFQSRASTAATNPDDALIKTSKLTFAVCLTTSLVLLFSAFYFFSSFHILNFLLTWISLSLLLGPFAPVSLTAGDVRVGHGDLLPEPSDPDPTQEENEDSRRRRRSRAQRSKSEPDPPAPVVAPRSVVPKKEEKRNENVILEEKDWTEEDFEILKKQIAKHPVGTPRRWEVIAEAFEGRHAVDSVIRTVKSLGEKRPGKDDSFAQFLRQRKPVDKRMDDIAGEPTDAISSGNGELKGNVGGESSSWTSGEDIALLNALKAFPKDTPMRWEKIEAAVPGKSKGSCMKRVAVLKKDFRSSKASEA